MHGNTLIRAVANGRIPLGKLPEMLDELIDSVMAHFRNESLFFCVTAMRNSKVMARSTSISSNARSSCAAWRFPASWRWPTSCRSLPGMSWRNTCWSMTMIISRC